MIATFIYTIVIYKAFDFEVFLEHTIKFNVTAPMYFVLLYIQLMLVNRVMYCMIHYVYGRKYEKLYLLLFGIIILLIALWTNGNTNIFSIFGGGGKLLGGTYLMLFYIGMISARQRHLNIIQSKWVFLGATLVFMLLSMGWWQFICINQFEIDKYILGTSGKNPPGILLSTLALLIIGICFNASRFVQATKSTWLHFGENILVKIGEKSLYIFLFHKLFLDYWLVPYVQINDIWIKRVIFFGVMIAGPIGISIIFQKTKKGLDYLLANAELVKK